MDTDIKKLLFIPQHYYVHPPPHVEWLNSFAPFFKCDYFCGVIESASNYDYIFVQSGAIDSNSLKRLKEKTGAKVIQWTGDCRSEIMNGVADYKNIADLTLLAVGIGQKEMYEAFLKHPVEYLQQGVAKSFLLEPNYLSDGNIVFIGNNYDHFEGAIERTELCKVLSSSFDKFEVIGNGFNLPEFNNKRSIPYYDSAEIYNKAYISISHACFNDIEGYYSNRTIDIMGAGGCCLMRYVPNIESIFTDIEHCIFYRTNDEAIEKIRLLLANPELRNKIAMQGHREVLSRHTFGYRTHQINEYIQKLKK